MIRIMEDNKNFELKIFDLVGWYLLFLVFQKFLGCKYSLISFHHLTEQSNIIPEFLIFHVLLSVRLAFPVNTM